MTKEFIWTEKYRPKTIEETILPPVLKKNLLDMVENGVTNAIFAGTAGLGKTTAAKAICNELDLDYIVINGSEDGNIDTLRNKIRQFASTVSFSGDYKVVIIDEADYLNPQSTQPALRGFIVEFSDNCRFIFTANFKNRIIEPLQSRCPVYEFNTSKKDVIPLAEEFYNRVRTILTEEGVEYDKKAVLDLIIRHAPDWRRILNELQRYGSSGKIDEGVFQNLSEETYDALFKFLKEKDFKNMRKWVVDNIDTDSTAIFRGVYDRLGTAVESNSIPQLILILADYSYKSAFVADAELNVVACMTEIMSNGRFK